MLNMIWCFHQEANKRNNKWLPPPWALDAFTILGFNEFMTLLRYFILFAEPYMNVDKVSTVLA